MAKGRGGRGFCNNSIKKSALIIKIMIMIMIIMVQKGKKKYYYTK